MMRVNHWPVGRFNNTREYYYIQRPERFFTYEFGIYFFAPRRKTRNYPTPPSRPGEMASGPGLSIEPWPGNEPTASRRRAIEHRASGERKQPNVKHHDPPKLRQQEMISEEELAALKEMTSTFETKKQRER
ncbi:MAG: hypothetical protein IPP17_30155 [Bacteroidetes bacterium]|nr:hypothetical protein [Bacteroidota bacterium]